jgi:hypothetical protein
VFGYRLKKVFSGTDRDGNPLCSHTEYEVNPVEAPVVLRAFELADAGHGLKSITRILRREGAPRPHYGLHEGETPILGWATSTIHALLRRELCRGEIVWNRWKKRDDWGQIGGRRRPDADVVRVPAKHLRWQRVQARRVDAEGRAVRFAGGRLGGRPRKDKVRHLLTGLAACGLCGGGLVVEQSGGRRVDVFDESTLADRSFLFEFPATRPAARIGAAGLSLRHGLLGC